MSTCTEDNSIPPSDEENSIPEEIISHATMDMLSPDLEMSVHEEGRIDTPTQKLERTAQDALDYMLSPELEMHVQGEVRIDIEDSPPQESLAVAQIFTIPSFVKRRNPKAYQPKMVSIGPYHFRKRQLKPMQYHKKRAVIQFLKRSALKATKDQYLEGLGLVYDALWKSYEQVPELRSWTKENFIKLMMVDGIFLLEFLDVVNGNRNGNDYADSDHIFGKRGHILNYKYVMEDLLLLENQVPYLVLSTLLDISQGLGAEENATKNHLAKLMFAPTAIEGHHLLDMYIKGILEGRAYQEPLTGEGAVKISADELTKTYGITFKPVATYKDIKFSRKSKTVKLPIIIIDKNTIRRFYNMKAYQLGGDTSKELICYIHLLNCFILSNVDVNSLRSQGIIISSLDSDEAVITVMNELTRDTMVGNIDDKSAGMIEKVRKYYDRKNYLFWIITRWRWVLALLGAALYVVNLMEGIYTIRQFG